MNNEHNIDELLKESFDNFSPEAPDVWQAVQQGVQAAQAAQASAAASSGTVSSVVQGVSLTVKIVTGVAIAAASVTGYLFYNARSSEKTAATRVAQQEITPQETVVPNAEEQKISVVAADPQTTVANPANHRARKTYVVRPERPVAETNPATQPVIPETKIQTPEPKRSETGNTQTTQEAKIIETLKSITDAAANENGREDVSPAEGKTSAANPYNPYAEDGEVFEKPTVPNVFTPNNDGLNDKFEVLIENETFYALKIMNEKGETVFESRNKTQLWDGRHYKTGQPCPTGKYMYILNYQYKGSERTHDMSGLIGLFF